VFYPHKRGNQKRGQMRRKSDSLLKQLTVKNVSYMEGIRRSINDIETVHKFLIPSPYLSSSLSSGAIATASTLDPTVRLDSFSKWAACFKQYLVLSITAVTVVSTTGSSVGTIWQQIAEDNSVPTGALVSEEKAIISLVAGNDPSKNSCTIVWRPKSAEDMAWTATGTSLALVYLKTYGNTINTLTSGGDSSTRVSTMFFYEIAFRYLV
jgi:hypothetical protein